MLERFESVAKAAHRVGVQPRRVRALLAAHEITGLRVGGAWLVEQDSVDRWAACGRKGGRPWNPANTWTALALLDGVAEGDARLQVLASPATQRRIQKRLGPDPVITDLAALFRRRATAHRLSAHPSAVARLAADPRIVRTAASSAAEHQLDLVEVGRVEAYVAARSLVDVRDEYALEDDLGGERNVLLRVVPDPWPFPPHTSVAGAAPVVLDLLDSADVRSTKAAVELDARRRAARTS